MNHPSDDQLLLLAYGELVAADQTAVETHLAQCGACRDRLRRLERARVALDWSAPAVRRPLARWLAGVGLAAAAVLAGLLLMRGGTSQPPGSGWSPPTVWSATAGYIAGGTGVIEIDAQLTRLEQERDHGLPD